MKSILNNFGASDIVSRLKAEKLTLSVAESCTGGLFSQVLTDVPGVSAVFLGGVVAYSNEVKLRVLGVSGEDLAAHGAVSEEVAMAMAHGVRTLMGSHFGVSTTGIAGPDGGTLEKPVGTVWISVSSKGNLSARRLQLEGDRQHIRAETVRILIEELSGALESGSID